MPLTSVFCEDHFAEFLHVVIFLGRRLLLFKRAFGDFLPLLEAHPLVEKTFTRRFNANHHIPSTAGGMTPADFFCAGALLALPMPNCSFRCRIMSRPCFSG